MWTNRLIGAETLNRDVL